MKFQNLYSNSNFMKEVILPNYTLPSTTPIFDVMFEGVNSPHLSKLMFGGDFTVNTGRCHVDA